MSSIEESFSPSMDHFLVAEPLCAASGDVELLEIPAGFAALAIELLDDGNGVV